MIKFKEMEDIFIQALVTRSKMEEGLIDLLPEDVKVMVEEKLSAGAQDEKVITDSGLVE